jgi:hypothetical protein
VDVDGWMYSIRVCIWGEVLIRVCLDCSNDLCSDFVLEGEVTDDKSLCVERWKQY